MNLFHFFAILLFIVFFYKAVQGRPLVHLLVASWVFWFLSRDSIFLATAFFLAWVICALLFDKSELDRVRDSSLIAPRGLVVFSAFFVFLKLAVVRLYDNEATPRMGDPIYFLIIFSLFFLLIERTRQDVD